MSGFVYGGLSGCIATCVVQPIDLIKTRMQLSGEGVAAKQHKTAFHAALSIAKAEGIKGMYKGLSAGILRQATYTTTRLGVYQALEEKFKTPGRPVSFLVKLVCGMTAGGIGAVVGTPAEVALIRMTSDGRLPPQEQRGYRNVFDALLRICREEGPLTMWRGVQPTIIRAMILNMAQLGGYSQSKDMLLAYMKDGWAVHFMASLLAGFFATAVSIPVDITKTRLQTMKMVDGVYPYTGTFDCARKVIEKEGILALWKGFTPYFLRLGPHTIITFVVLEQLKRRLL
uniref:Mitochondrial 2-oxoglutarate/malate carrier protein n=1 Tax=Arcella intermedia TaxID=1963864 RepID=A0A6B2LC93_9EUKA